ncbi:unnamed protein product [Penicillium nalgiovense]|nr:unnamed protein product [Penicillium nalgiovense]
MVVQLLLDRGADVNTRGGKYGNTLQAASSYSNEMVVQLLLDRGADVNTRGGKYGNTLQAASSYSNEMVVQLLLDRGADVNTRGGKYSNTLRLRHKPQLGPNLRPNPQTALGAVWNRPNRNRTTVFDRFC